MKRINCRKRLYNIRISLNREKRRLRHRRQRKAALRLTEQYKCISAPEEFTVSDDLARKALLGFFKELRYQTATEGKSVQIDFASTKRMYADGTILFRAEISRLIELLPRATKIRCKPPRNLKVSQVLKQVGIYDLLRCACKVTPTFADVVYWRAASGVEVLGEKYDDILGPYDGVISEEVSKGLYRGLTEAMNNVHHHAYIDIRADGLDTPSARKDWWMFSQKKDNRLFVVFCDLGIGIPRSLPKTIPSLWKRISDAVRGPRDGLVIEETIKYSRTRTEKEHRGKGLKELVETIEAVPDSHLRIYSNRGCYTIQNKAHSSWSYQDSILGTLIAWTVPLEAGN